MKNLLILIILLATLQIAGAQETKYYGIESRSWSSKEINDSSFNVQFKKADGVMTREYTVDQDGVFKLQGSSTLKKGSMTITVTAGDETLYRRTITKKDRTIEIDRIFEDLATQKITITTTMSNASGRYQITWS
ncbi:MAG: hypothetical protein WBG46_09400 [Nonlabens sp.]